MSTYLNDRECRVVVATGPVRYDRDEVVAPYIYLRDDLAALCFRRFTDPTEPAARSRKDSRGRLISKRKGCLLAWIRIAGAPGLGADRAERFQGIRD
jgi:hypothetical protein